jgi:hypothetical protein
MLTNPSNPLGSDSKNRELVVMMSQDHLRQSFTLQPASKRNVTSVLTGALQNHKAQLKPLFPDAVKDVQAHDFLVQPMDLSSKAALTQFYTVDAPDDELESLQGVLLKEPSVEAAYFVPRGSPPKMTLAASINVMSPSAAPAPAITPDFTSRQLYLGPAPSGIDAQYAWTKPGGDGAGVAIIDLEWGWTLDHEDLKDNNGGLVYGTASSDVDHGTAVLGVFHGDRNAIGVTGIAPGSSFRVGAFTAGLPSDTSPAIVAAADALSAGDLMLLEIHRPGPNSAGDDQGSQFGYIPIEWWPQDYAAIRYATDRGIIVIEAGGNGAQNLNDPVYDTPATGFPSSWTNPFRRHRAPTTRHGLRIAPVWTSQITVRASTHRVGAARSPQQAMVISKGAPCSSSTRTSSRGHRALHQLSWGQ